MPTYGGGMATHVVHNPTRSRYELTVDGEDVGSTHYRVEGNTIRFSHTEVDTERREGGLGGQLVRGTLDQVRAETDYRVVPECPFMRSWIQKHPEYQDLLER